MIFLTLRFLTLPSKMILFKKISIPFIAFIYFISFLGCSSNNSEAQDENQEVLQILSTQPINGDYQGVIELGGNGFNSFIINIDSLGNWFLEKAQYGVSNVYENQVSEDSIRDGLEKYIESMLQYNVEAKDIHFIMSSTASSNSKVIAISEVLTEMGYVVNSVDATKEGEYALIATLPKMYEKEGFVVDIGSGNTKISWMENNAIQSIDTYGSKYYVNGTSDETVYSEVVKLLKQVPKQQSKVCFLIGGVPYNLSKQARVDDERYVSLNKPDEYQFDDPKLKAGINIYAAIVESTQSKQYVFDSESNFSIGFLIEKTTLESSL